MKRFIVPVILMMMFCVLALPGHDASAANQVSVKVNTIWVSFPDQKPYIDSASRTMVPVRAPMEAMGCTVDWNASAQQATITKGDKVAVFAIGSNTYTVNGETKTMDTKAVITNNRTAFPIRFAAEAMGATVGWDAATYTVNISTQPIVLIDGVKYHAPIEAGRIPYIYIDRWNPEKIANACNVFEIVFSDSKTAGEIETYLMGCYNSATEPYKTFTLVDGRRATVLVPRGSKDISITIHAPQ